MGKMKPSPGLRPNVFAMRAGKRINLNKPIFHLGMDFYQGLPGAHLFSQYHIIAYRYNPIVKQLQKRGVKVFTLADKLKRQEIVPRSSGHLLAHPLVQEYIKRESGAKQPIISFFKPSPKIEMIARKNHWLLAGGSHKLNKKLENKVNFLSLLAKNKSVPTPKAIITHSPVNSPSIIDKLGLPVVIQSPRGWSGRATHLVNTKQELIKILKRANGVIKVAEYIPGITVTNNAVITKTGKIIQSGPAYQLTGEPMLTDLPMATCGRAWPAKLDTGTVKQIKESSKSVARTINKLGFKGFFGLDFVIHPQNKKAYLIELNPRLTASFPFYTLLEIQAGLTPLLVHHYRCFVDFDIPPQQKSRKKRSQIKGSEIIQRNCQKQNLIIQKTLRSGGYINKEKQNNQLSPLENQLTLIAPEVGESIRFNQEVFKISTKKQVLAEKNNRIIIDERTTKALKLFRENIQ